MSLQAYTQQPCVPCTKSELDLESIPPLQIGVVDDYLVCTGPKLGPESGRPLELLIPTSGDDYLNLSHCYLYLQCWVLKDDSNTTGEDGSVALMNLLFHSLFRQLDLVMNDALVANSGDTYPYRAYLTLLLSYGRDAKETWLNHLEGWCTKEHDKCDAGDNTVLLSSLNRILNSEPFDFKGRLHLDMLLQVRLLPNNMNVQLVLSRSRPALHLMHFNGKSSYHVRMEEAVLKVGKVKVAAFEHLRLEKVLTASGANYQLAHVVTRHFALAAVTGLYAEPVCRDLPRPAKVRQDLPQPLEQWLVCQPVRWWHHALVLGPDARRHWLDGLLVTQVSGYREGQSWDSPSPCRQRGHFQPMLSMITWWFSMPTVTFDYNTWWSGGNFRRPSWESPQWPRHWLVFTTGKNLGPFPSGSRLPT